MDHPEPKDLTRQNSGKSAGIIRQRVVSQAWMEKPFRRSEAKLEIIATTDDKIVLKLNCPAPASVADQLKSAGFVRFLEVDTAERRNRPRMLFIGPRSESSLRLIRKATASLSQLPPKAFERAVRDVRAKFQSVATRERKSSKIPTFQLLARTDAYTIVTFDHRPIDSVAELLRQGGFVTFIAAASNRPGPGAAYLAPGSEGAIRAISSIEDALYRLTALEAGERRSSTPRPPLYNWQQKALSKWIANGKCGIVTAVTGAGKTNLAIEAIHEHLLLPGARAVVLVPTITLQKQWYEKMNEYLGTDVGLCGDRNRASLQTRRAVIYVRDSAKLYLLEQLRPLERTVPLLFVADECHRYATDDCARAGIFSNAFQARLGLSATPRRPYDDGYGMYLAPFFRGEVFNYGYEDALADRTIANFYVAYIALSFDVDEQHDYLTLSERIQKAKDQLRRTYPGIRSGKAFFPDVKVQAQQEEFKQRELRPATAFLGLLHKRTEILITARARLRFLSDPNVIGAIAKHKSLTFHKRIELCEQVRDAYERAGIPANVHHSEINRKERVTVLDRFKMNDVRAVVAPETLTEGIDVPDSDLAIIAAGSMEERALIQKSGRVLRPHDNKVLARILVMYVRGSREDPELRYVDDDDEFAAESFDQTLRKLGRLSEFNYPEDKHRIVNWMANDGFAAG